ncbi:MAG: hypothetical protein WDN69_14855 [Aliidongia sp.]
MQPWQLLCSGLAFGVPAMAAVENKTVLAEPAATEDGPTTLRAAVELVARHFDFDVVGAGRIGTDPPAWPAEDLPARRADR